MCIHKKRPERTDRNFLFCLAKPKCIKQHGEQMSNLNNIFIQFQYKFGESWGTYFCQLLFTLFSLQACLKFSAHLSMSDMYNISNNLTIRKKCVNYQHYCRLNRFKLRSVKQKIFYFARVEYFGAGNSASLIKINF